MGNCTMGINKKYLTAERTVTGDEVYTPFYAVEPLLEFLPKNKVIWCPFDEDWSAFYQLLSENGYQVVRSNLKNNQDFFEYEPKHWDLLVSNPPFSKKDAVLQRAFEFSKPFALLLPTNSIQGKKRFELFRNGIQLLVFDARVDYHTRNNFLATTKGNHFSSSYFCRNLLPSNLEFRRLNKYERPLKSR